MKLSKTLFLFENRKSLIELVRDCTTVHIKWFAIIMVDRVHHTAVPIGLPCITSVVISTVCFIYTHTHTHTHTFFFYSSVFYTKVGFTI